MAIWLNLFVVGVGGFLGAVGRYLVTGWVHRFVPLSLFPLGTLVANLLGCLLLGFVAGLADERQAFSPRTRLLAVVGFLGSFTTFSTFSLESLALLEAGKVLRFGANAAGQVVLGLLAVAVGMAMARAVSHRWLG